MARGRACDLCAAEPLTRRYYDDPTCWIADCAACGVPMVVDRKHRTDPPAKVRDAMLDRLRTAAEERFDEPWMIDHDRRTIPDHWHAHARPAMLGEKVYRVNAADGGSFWIKRTRGVWHCAGELPEGVPPSPPPIRWGSLATEIGIWPEEWEPGTWRPGQWRTYDGPLIPKARGLHVARREDLAFYLGPEIWEAEVEGEVAVGDKEVVAHRVRVTRRFDTWTARTARLFAVDCAERVLRMWEEVSDDVAPGAALRMARQYAEHPPEPFRSRLMHEMAWPLYRLAMEQPVVTARIACLSAMGASQVDVPIDEIGAGGAYRHALWAATYAGAGVFYSDSLQPPEPTPEGEAFRAWATERLFSYLEPG